MITHNLKERQAAMRLRVAKSRARTRTLEQQATAATIKARKTRRLRDKYKAVLLALQIRRKNLYHVLEHVKRDSRRAIAKAAEYAVECDRERQRIELAREIGASL